MENLIVMLIVAPIAVLILLVFLILRDLADQWADPKIKAILNSPAVAGRLQRRRDRNLYRIGIVITALGILPILAALQALVRGGMKGGPVSTHTIEAVSTMTITVGLATLMIWWWSSSRPRGEIDKS